MNNDKKIQFLLAGRRAANLSERYALNRNWEKNIREQKGTYKLIAPLVLAENISADWLLGGHGAPYRVDYYFDAQRMAAAVVAQLGQGGWSVFMIDADAVLIWRYAALQPDDVNASNFVEYQLHVGPSSPALIKALSAPDLLVQFADLSDDSKQNIKAGQLGSYALFGYPMEKGGLLSEDKNWPAMNPERLRSFFAAASTPLSPKAQKHAEQINQLKPEQQAVIDALLATYRE